MIGSRLAREEGRVQQVTSRIFVPPLSSASFDACFRLRSASCLRHTKLYNISLEPTLIALRAVGTLASLGAAQLKR